MGHVTPARAQKRCGSCVAFANMAAIETCFARLTGVFGDYAEQQLLDCGFQKEGANGCNGAPIQSYITWASKTGLQLTHENYYPYKAARSTQGCRHDVKTYNQGAKISDAYYTGRATEELMKELVYEHGAVVTTVQAEGPFMDYGGGVFSGCRSAKTDHAVTVVGYGTDAKSGKPYWLIKNSWGKNWGENGFIRLERGVGMCGVGSIAAVVKCAKVAGPTDAPLTTPVPCLNRYSNCNVMTRWCWRPQFAKNCQKACGLCPGMTPVESVTCYDVWSNCPQLARYCKRSSRIRNNCKKSCRTC